MELRIGDLVQCRDDHYNRGLGIVRKIGMVAELRRRDVRILFDVDNQFIWLSKNGVNRITLTPTDSPTLLERLTWLIRHVDAEESEASAAAHERPSEVPVLSLELVEAREQLLVDEFPGRLRHEAMFVGQPLGREHVGRRALVEQPGPPACRG